MVQRKTLEKTREEWRFLRRCVQSSGASFHPLFPVKVKPGVKANNSNIWGSFPNAEELVCNWGEIIVFISAVFVYCLNPHASVLGINLNLEITSISFEQYADKLKVKLGLKYVLPFTKVTEN